MKSILAGIMCLMLLGCMTKNDDPIKFTFPPDAKVMCDNALNNSKAKIQSRGTALAIKRIGCEVIKVKGEKKVGNMWVFIPKGYDRYVGGICWGNRIEIGCNPITGGEVIYDILEHEFAHYWLYSNFGDMTHNLRYSGLFIGWTMKIYAKSGSYYASYVNEVSSNGVLRHIDFVE